MKSKKKKLLWIDDDIDKLMVYVNELRKYKINVHTASNYAEAKKIFDEVEPDVIVADIRMPDPDGIEIIRRLSDIDSTKVYAVFSSYLYLGQYRDSLAGLSLKVQLMDKDFPRVSDPTFYDRFIKPFINLFDKGVSYTILDSCESKRAVDGVEPFSIEFADFMLKPIIEKDMLTDKAYADVQKVLDNIFKRGIVWALFCGNKETPLRVAERIDEIPSEDEILEFARKINRAPYHFYRHLVVEDHWTVCASADDISQLDYPTVTLLFNNGSSREEMELHFDTGCPFTMFSYEELSGKKIIPTAVTFGYGERKGFEPYKIVQINNLNAILKSQKSDQTIGVKISGTAIRDWHKSSYARLVNGYCKIKCEQEKNHVDLCPLRRGLIGRNILTENKIAIILDGDIKKTYFPGEL